MLKLQYKHCRLVIIGILTSVVWGCESTSGNPATDGIIGGLAGVLGGGYQKRVDEKQQRVNELTAKNKTLNAHLQQSEQEHSAVLAEKQTLNQQLRKLLSSLSLSKKILQQEQHNKAIDTQVLTDLQKKQYGLEKALNKLSRLSLEYDTQALTDNSDKLKADRQRLNQQSLLLEQDIKEHHTLINQLFGIN